MTTENNFKKGKYTLLYSPTAAKAYGAKITTTNDGVCVEYTGLTDENAYGPWESNCIFDDVVVVGYIDNRRDA